MTFAQRQNCLTTHFSERNPVVKRRMTCTCRVSNEIESFKVRNWSRWYSPLVSAVAWLRRFVTALSPFDPRPDQVRFGVDSFKFPPPATFHQCYPHISFIKPLSRTFSRPLHHKYSLQRGAT